MIFGVQYLSVGTWQGWKHSCVLGERWSAGWCVGMCVSGGPAVLPLSGEGPRLAGRENNTAPCAGQSSSPWLRALLCSAVGTVSINLAVPHRCIPEPTRWLYKGDMGRFKHPRIEGLYLYYNLGHISSVRFMYRFTFFKRLWISEHLCLTSFRSIFSFAVGYLGDGFVI